MKRITVLAAAGVLVATPAIGAWAAFGAIDENPTRDSSSVRVDDHGRPARTLGVIGALELSRPDEGQILPHEHTTKKAKTDRLDARTLAKLLWAGELDGVWAPDERGPGDAPPVGAASAVGPGALAGQERDPRGVDARSEGSPAGRGTCSGSKAGRG